MVVGFMQLKKLRRSNPEAKIIAVTGDSRFTTEQKLEKLKIPVIYKPFKMDEVISKMPKLKIFPMNGNRHIILYYKKRYS